MYVCNTKTVLMKTIQSPQRMVLTGIISSKAQTPCDEPLYLKATTSLCTNPMKVVIDNFDPNFAANYSWSFSIPPASVNFFSNNSVAVIDRSNINTLVCNNNSNPYLSQRLKEFYERLISV